MKKREKSFNQQSALRAHPGSSDFAELIRAHLSSPEFIELVELIRAYPSPSSSSELIELIRAHYDDICGGDYSES